MVCAFRPPARAALLGAAFVLAGCGGGSSAVPSRLAAGGHEVPVAISIAIPRRGGAANAHQRRPEYVSTATASAVVEVTPAGTPTTRTVVRCGISTCVGTVPARVGLDTFLIALNDAPDGTGSTLSSGQTTATVTEGQNNAVSVTFNGVIASLSVALAPNNPPVNAPATINLNVKAYDADGRLIIGPGSYDNPIALTDLDTTGATALSAQTINSPNDPQPMVSYNGAWIGGNTASAYLAASVPANAHVKAAQDQLIPMPQLAEFTIPTAYAEPDDITTGPDGALWFTESAVQKIGRVTTAGALTEIAIPGQYSYPEAITSNADGNLYVADMAYGHETLDQVTTAGVVSRHSIALPPPERQRNFDSMVAGPDQNLWAPDYSVNTIDRFTPTGVETDFTVPSANAGPIAITAGSDGALWFTQNGAPAIGRITTAGAFTEFPIVLSSGGHGGSSYGITSAADGTLWYTDNFSETVGRMTTAGTGGEFPGSYLYWTSGYAIVPGPDGAIYFGNGSTLTRVSAQGTIQSFTIPAMLNRNSSFTRFTVGPDGNIWYIDRNANVVGKIVF